MLRIAIDIDGTISGHVEFFQRLISGETFAPEEITILTTADPNAWSDGHTECGNYENLVCRQNQLALLGIPRHKYSKIVSVMRETHHPGVGIAKGEYCRDNAIDYMFEDDADYAAHIKNLSPKTMVFLIQ
jgi:hypothetical protein